MEDKKRKNIQTEDDVPNTPAGETGGESNEADTSAQIAEMKAEYEKQIAEMKAQMEAQMEEQLSAFKEALNAAQKPQIVQVTASTEMVRFLWMAPVADDNVQDFGPGGIYGRIIGKQGELFVPKNDLSRVLDNMTRLFLKKRWLIVVDGLGEDELEALGANYSEGELLDRKAFARLVELGDKILDIFPKLCRGHKEMVEKRFYEAWQDRNPYIRRETVAELNRMAKDAGMNRNAFGAIIEEMNAAQV